MVDKKHKKIKIKNLISSFKKISSNQKKFLKYLLIFIICLFAFYFIKGDSHKKTELSGNTESADSIKNQPVVEEEKKITKEESVCLDPGHGGNDTGAIYKKLVESEVNLTVAQKLKEMLEADGYQVYLTRSNDDFVAKRDRARYCNSEKATILVSIHHNTYEEDPSVNYNTVLYYKDVDRPLASSIIESTSLKLGVKNQGISKFNNSLFWVAEMPSVLLESFFLTNRMEYQNLIKSHSERLDEEAEGIKEGIVNYFANPNQDTAADTVDADSLIIDRSDYD